MYNIIFSVRKLPRRPFIEIVKCFNTSSTKLKPRGVKGIRSPNPGIQGQLNIDSEENFQEDTFDIEEMESDFMQLDKMHHLHEMQEDKRKQVVQLKMVGHKYFKPFKSPNLLTWAEKEQIRYLHNSDSEKWSVQKLAHSFPASEEIIKKILKSSWKPADSARILKHDQIVQKNWDLLRSGKLEIAPEFKNHVQQFTGRTIPAHQSIPDPSVEEKWRPRPKKTEFGNIIESYKHLKGEDTEKSAEVVHVPQKYLVEPKDETYVVKNESESYVKYGHSTLDRYRERIDSAMKKGHTPSPDARLMLESNSDNASTLHEVQNNESISVAVSESQNVEIDLGKDDYPPEWIKIPPKKWRRGATFKMGDCYYDDDGSFLYRVPGMK